MIGSERSLSVSGKDQTFYSTLARTLERTDLLNDLGVDCMAIKKLNLKE
jgi:hypothetical protein